LIVLQKNNYSRFLFFFSIKLGADDSYSPILKSQIVTSIWELKFYFILLFVFVWPSKYVLPFERQQKHKKQCKSFSQKKPQVNFFQSWNKFKSFSFFSQILILLLGISRDKQPTVACLLELSENQTIQNPIPCLLLEDRIFFLENKFLSHTPRWNRFFLCSFIFGKLKTFTK